MSAVTNNGSLGGKMEIEESKALDFFISYTGADQTWAEWIAWVLEEAEYTVKIQAWDFTAGSNFVLEMDDGIREAQRTVLVLSPAYIKSGMCRAEWAATFADDPDGAKKKFLPARVEEFRPDGLLKAIVYEDFVRKSEAESKAVLLKAAKGGRRKPDTAPGFPGATSHSPATTATKPAPRFPATKPAVWTVPYVRNAYFTGREETLSDLHKALSDGQAAAMSQVQAVHGLGGVGKTQVAVEYAYRYWSEYDAVLWVNADSAASLDAGLAGLAGPMALGLPEASASEQQAQVDAVVRWLGTHENWLLILDNADSDEAIGAVSSLLGQGVRGHVIVTSRRSNWGLEFAVIPLDVLSPADAVRFLVQRTSSSEFSCGSEEEGSELARELGYLPLALEQAAAYIRIHKVRFRDYTDKLATQRKILLAAGSRGGTKYPSSLAETWLITETRLSPMSKALLRMLAFMAPEPVPRFLFGDEAGIPEEAEELLVGLGASPSSQSGTSVEDALVVLADHSMISLSPEWVNCHRLVQAVQVDRMSSQEQADWFAAAWRILDNAAPNESGDVRTWPIWTPLAPHAKALASRDSLVAKVPGSAVLISRLGGYLYFKAQYGEAEPLMRRALEIDERSYGKDHPYVATCLNNLALLLKATNRLAEAEPLMRRALEIDERGCGQDCPKVAAGLNNLAQLLQETNRLAEAEPLLRRALEIDEGSYGKDHPYVARDLNNLAALLQETNRLAEAEPLMRRALEISERSYGKDHPKVATSLNNLAALLQQTNRLAEAEPLVRRALEIRERCYGKDHPNVATGLNNLAALLQETNRLAEAESLMRRALEIDEGSYGKDHPKVATGLNNLAQLLKETNRLAEAEPLMRRALEIDERSYGEDHPDVATGLNNLAQLLKATNRLAEAEPLMRRALVIDERSYGEDHPEVAKSLNNLALLLLETSRLAEAEPLSRRAFEILLSFTRATGHEHPHLRATLNNYRGLLRAMGMASPETQEKLGGILAQYSVKLD